ncbi:MAG: acetyl-CoA carboxylase biotin carboxyl carrier protein subunit [Chitinophagales bacterium]
MFKAKVNDHFNFDIDLNNTSEDWDILPLKDGKFHLIQNHQSYNIEVINIDLANKRVLLLVNDKEFEVELKDKMDLLLEKMGISAAVSQKVNDIKAPMPGLVLEIKVKAGDSIQKGDAVLVLEAMKMENVLKSSGEGIVDSIEVKVGDAVEKNQILLKMQ